MNKFYYSRTYEFTLPNGSRKHYFFILVERNGANARFQLIDKDNIETVESDIVLDGEVETTTFPFHGTEISLRVDRFHHKGYRITPEGRIEKEEDKLRDAHLHTSHNRREVENSKECNCICCQRIFPADEIEDYADGGETAICPYCDCDTLIADSSGIKLTKELLSQLNKKYF